MQRVKRSFSIGNGADVIHKPILEIDLTHYPIFPLDWADADPDNSDAVIQMQSFGCGIRRGIVLGLGLIAKIGGNNHCPGSFIRKDF